MAPIKVMDHPGLTACSFMESSIGLIRVNKQIDYTFIYFSKAIYRLNVYFDILIDNHVVYLTFETKHAHIHWYIIAPIIDGPILLQCAKGECVLMQ